MGIYDNYDPRELEDAGIGAPDYVKKYIDENRNDGFLGDTVTDLKQGALSVGEGLVGLADLAYSPFADEGDQSLSDSFGGTFDRARARMSDEYSGARMSSDSARAAEVGDNSLLEAKDAGDFGVRLLKAVSAAVANPRSAIGDVSQSLPIMGASMVPGAGAASIASKLGAGAKVVAGATRAGSALGEGAASAGLAVNDITRYNAQNGRDHYQNVGYAVPIGAAVSAIGYAGNFGKGGFEAALASKAARNEFMKSASGTGKKSFLKDLGSAGMQEGLEEGFQTTAEQGLSNLAKELPFTAGLPEAIGEGFVAGAGMGVGGHALARGVDRVGRFVDTHRKTDLLNKANTPSQLAGAIPTPESSEGSYQAPSVQDYLGKTFAQVAPQPVATPDVQSHLGKTFNQVAAQSPGPIDQPPAPVAPPPQKPRTYTRVFAPVLGKNIFEARNEKKATEALNNLSQVPGADDLAISVGTAMSKRGLTKGNEQKDVSSVVTGTNWLISEAQERGLINEESTADEVVRAAFTVGREIANQNPNLPANNEFFDAAEEAYTGTPVVREQPVVQDNSVQQVANESQVGAQEQVATPTQGIDQPVENVATQATAAKTPSATKKAAINKETVGAQVAKQTQDNESKEPSSGEDKKKVSKAAIDVNSVGKGKPIADSKKDDLALFREVAPNIYEAAGAPGSKTQAASKKLGRTARNNPNAKFLIRSLSVAADLAGVRIRPIPFGTIVDRVLSEASAGATTEAEFRAGVKESAERHRKLMMEKSKYVEAGMYEALSDLMDVEDSGIEEYKITKKKELDEKRKEQALKVAKKEADYAVAIREKQKKKASNSELGSRTEELLGYIDMDLLGMITPSPILEAYIEELSDAIYAQISEKTEDPLSPTDIANLIIAMKNDVRLDERLANADNKRINTALGSRAGMGKKGLTEDATKFVQGVKDMSEAFLQAFGRRPYGTELTRAKLQAESSGKLPKGELSDTSLTFQKYKQKGKSVTKNTPQFSSVVYVFKHLEKLINTFESQRGQLPINQMDIFMDAVNRMPLSGTFDEEMFRSKIVSSASSLTPAQAKGAGSESIVYDANRSISMDSPQEVLGAITPSSTEVATYNNAAEDIEDDGFGYNDSSYDGTILLNKPSENLPATIDETFAVALKSEHSIESLERAFRDSEKELGIVQATSNLVEGYIHRANVEADALYLFFRKMERSNGGAPQMIRALEEVIRGSLKESYKKLVRVAESEREPGAMFNMIKQSISGMKARIAEAEKNGTNAELYCLSRVVARTIATAPFAYGIGISKTEKVRLASEAIDLYRKTFELSLRGYVKDSKSRVLKRSMRILSRKMLLVLMTESKEFSTFFSSAVKKVNKTKSDAFGYREEELKAKDLERFAESDTISHEDIANALKDEGLKVGLTIFDRNTYRTNGLSDVFDKFQAVSEGVYRSDGIGQKKEFLFAQSKRPLRDILVKVIDGLVAGDVLPNELEQISELRLVGVSVAAKMRHDAYISEYYSRAKTEHIRRGRRSLFDRRMEDEAVKRVKEREALKIRSRTFALRSILATSMDSIPKDASIGFLTEKAKEILKNMAKKGMRTKDSDETSRRIAQWDRLDAKEERARELARKHVKEDKGLQDSIDRAKKDGNSERVKQIEKGRAKVLDHRDEANRKRFNKQVVLTPEKILTAFEYIYHLPDKHYGVTGDSEIDDAKGATEYRELIEHSIRLGWDAYFGAPTLETEENATELEPEEHYSESKEDQEVETEENTEELVDVYGENTPEASGVLKTYKTDNFPLRRVLPLLADIYLLQAEKDERVLSNITGRRARGESQEDFDKKVEHNRKLMNNGLIADVFGLRNPNGVFQRALTYATFRAGINPRIVKILKTGTEEQVKAAMDYLTKKLDDAAAKVEEEKLEKRRRRQAAYNAGKNVKSIFVKPEEVIREMSDGSKVRILIRSKVPSQEVLDGLVEKENAGGDKPLTKAEQRLKEFLPGFIAGLNTIAGLSKTVKEEKDAQKVKGRVSRAQASAEKEIKEQLGTLMDMAKEASNLETAVANERAAAMAELNKVIIRSDEEKLSDYRKEVSERISSKAKEVLGKAVALKSLGRVSYNGVVIATDPGDAPKLKNPETSNYHESMFYGVMSNKENARALSNVLNNFKEYEVFPSGFLITDMEPIRLRNGVREKDRTPLGGTITLQKYGDSVNGAASCTYAEDLRVVAHEGKTPKAQSLIRVDLRFGSNASKLFSEDADGTPGEGNRNRKGSYREFVITHEMWHAINAKMGGGISKLYASELLLSGEDFEGLRKVDGLMDVFTHYTGHPLSTVFSYANEVRREAMGAGPAKANSIYADELTANMLAAFITNPVFRVQLRRYAKKHYQFCLEVIDGVTDPDGGLNGTREKWVQQNRQNSGRPFEKTVRKYGKTSENRVRSRGRDPLGSGVLHTSDEASSEEASMVEKSDGPVPEGGGEEHSWLYDDGDTPTRGEGGSADDSGMGGSNGAGRGRMDVRDDRRTGREVAPSTDEVGLGGSRGTSNVHRGSDVQERAEGRDIRADGYGGSSANDNGTASNGGNGPNDSPGVHGGPRALNVSTVNGEASNTSGQGLSSSPERDTDAFGVGARRERKGESTSDDNSRPVDRASKSRPDRPSETNDISSQLHQDTAKLRSDKPSNIMVGEKGVGDGSDVQRSGDVLRPRSKQSNAGGLPKGHGEIHREELGQNGREKEGKNSWAKVPERFYRKYPWLYTAANSSKKLIYGTMFTRDLVDIAKKHLPSIEAWDAFAKKMYAYVNERQNIANDFSKRYAKLNEASKKKVNSYLENTNISGVWGYAHSSVFQTQEDWDSYVAGLSEEDASYLPGLEEGYENLSDQEKDIVDEVLGNTYDDYVEREHIVEENERRALERAGGNDTAVSKARIERMKNAGARNSIAVPKPYIPLSRRGSHVVVMKSLGMQKVEDELSSLVEEIRGTEDKEELKKLREEARALKEKVNAMAASSLNYYVEYFNDAGSAYQAAEALRDEYGDSARIRNFARQEHSASSVPAWQKLEQVMVSAQSLLEDEHYGAGIDENGEASAQLINEMAMVLYLRSLQGDNARTRNLHRRNVSGYDANMVKNYLETSASTANLLGNLKYGTRIRSAYKDIVEEARRSKNAADAYDVLNEVTKRNEQMMRGEHSETTQRIMRGVAFMTLLTRPAYYLQNMSQFIVMSAPYMAGKFGASDVAKYMTAATKEVAAWMKKSGIAEDLANTLSEEEKDAFTKIRRSGLIDISFSQEFGSITDAGEMSKGLKAFKSVSDKLTQWSKDVETINRVATFLSAYRLSKASGMSSEEAYAYAERTIYDTHGDYSGHNAPRYFRMNSVAKIATQFRKFQLIQLGVMVRTLKDAFDKNLTAEERSIARHQLAWFAATYISLTGIKGTPFAMLLMAIPTMIFGGGGDDEEDFLRDTLFDVTGSKAVAEALTRGLPSAFGLDVSGTVGATNMLSLFPFVDASATDGREGVAKYALAMTGPLGGLASKIADGVMYAYQGDYQKGLEGMLPSGLSDLSKAARILNEGLTDKGGDVVLSSKDVSSVEAFLIAMGLPPSVITERNRIQTSLFNHEKYFDAKYGNLRKSFREAMKARDHKAMAEIRKGFVELNKEAKEKGLKAKPVSSLFTNVRLHRKLESNVINGVKTSPSNRDFVKRVSER